MVNSKTWDYTQANLAFGALEFGSGLFVLSWLCAHDTAGMILQLANRLCFKMSHSTGLWFWSSSWDGLRKRFLCIHFQQILNQNQIKFSVVYFVTAG
jgi:hypothetical protein